MKKSVIAVSAVLLVAAGIVLPAGYFGQVAENTLKSRLANMPYGMQVDVVDYRRGWFSSIARLEWRPDGNPAMPAMPGQDPLGADYAVALAELVSGPIAVDLEIAHGPVFFAVGPGVGLFNARGRIEPHVGAEANAEPREDRDNFVDVYVSSFSGRTVTNRLEFQDLDWNPGPVSLKLAGGRLAGEWTGPGAFQLQHASLERMDVIAGTDDAVVRVSITDVVSRTEYPQGLETGAILAPSESNLSIGEVRTAGSGGNTLIHMTGLSSLVSTSVGEDGLYRTTGRLGIESLEVMGREFASVEVTQDVANFSESAMLKLSAALSSGIFEEPENPQTPGEEPQAPSATPPGGPVAGLLPQLTAGMREAVRALLETAPTADVGAVAAYQGEHALKMDSHQAFYPDRVPAGVDLASLAAILSSLEYTLNIEVPRVAAEDLFGPDLLQGALAQMLLEENETAYSLSLAINNGKIELNGQTLPLSLPGATPSPFDGAVSFPLGEDEPNPFDQAPPPPPD